MRYSMTQAFFIPFSNTWLVIRHRSCFDDLRPQSALGENDERLFWNTEASGQAGPNAQAIRARRQWF